MTNKHMKRSAILIIREIKIKTTMRYYFTLTRMSRNKKLDSVGKTVQKSEPSSTTGENVKRYSHFGKQFGSFSHN